MSTFILRVGKKMKYSLVSPTLQKNITEGFNEV